MANLTGRGYFQKGQQGGPGRPKRSVEQRYLDVTMAACPVDKWRKVVATAVEQAEKGDAKARDFLARVLFGNDPVLLLQFVALQNNVAVQVEMTDAERAAAVRALLARVGLGGPGPDSNGQGVPPGPLLGEGGGSADGRRDDPGPLAGGVPPLGL
jgi:hypothetical protein